jgi:hypothetical protein
VDFRGRPLKLRALESAPANQPPCHRRPPAAPDPGRASLSRMNVPMSHSGLSGIRLSRPHHSGFSGIGRLGFPSFLNPKPQIRNPKFSFPPIEQTTPPPGICGCKGLAWTAIGTRAGSRKALKIRILRHLAGSPGVWLRGSKITGDASVSSAAAWPWRPSPSSWAPRLRYGAQFEKPPNLLPRIKSPASMPPMRLPGCPRRRAMPPSRPPRSQIQHRIHYRE